MTFAEYLSLYFPLFVEFWNSLMLSPVDVALVYVYFCITCIVGLHFAVGYFVKRLIEKAFRKGRKVNYE